MSDRFDPLAPLGSRQWWDYQLAHSWEQNRGPQQTRYFAECLIAHLPAAESEYLRSAPRTVLDWGCATGEAVARLSEEFPLCGVSGLDVAQSAIETAQTRYPRHEFILTQEGEIEGHFDVILTSNCLEHFADPVAVARRHLAATRALYLVLVPCREQPVMYGHWQPFEEESLPEFLDGFVRLSVASFSTDPKFWSGEQMLVVYGSQEYVAARPPQDEASGGRRREDWLAYFHAPPELRALIEDLASRRAITSKALGETLARKQALENALEKALVQSRG